MSDDPIDQTLARIERLAALHAAGALTDAEFAAGKARILAAGEAAPRSVEPEAASVALREDPRPSPVVPPEPFYEENSGGTGRGLLIMAGVAMLFLVIVGAVLLGTNVATVPEAAPTPLARSSPRATPTPVASPTPAAQEIGDALAFRDAANCEWGPTAEKAFRAMLEFDGDTGRPRPVRPVALAGLSLLPQPEVRNADDVVPGGRVYRSEVRFPEETYWNGLRLGRLIVEHDSYPETDDQDSRTITFREQSDVVRRALARLGATVPEGRYTELTNEACGGSMEIKPMAGGAALICGWGC